MKPLLLRKSWMILLVLIAFVSICSAQSIRIIEKLPDGSYVVAIDDVEFRAITGDKAIELAKQKVDLFAALKTNTELVGQVKEALLQRDLAETRQALVQQKADSFEADFKRSQEDAKRNFGLFMGERELRVGAQSFIPHSTVNGFWGKVLNALDHPASQSIFKMGLPILNTLRCQQ